MDRQIIHVDMDEFFAAVEKLDRPELRGKCLLVGGSPTGRGVVSTASYEARPFGCHSAMPMAKAVRLCPQAVVLPVRFERYRQVSEQIFDVFDRFTPLVEPLSIDEAFLDVTGCLRLLGSGEEIARNIKEVIRKEVGLTASLGVAPNKFLAKVASDLGKPDGLVTVTPQNMHALLDPLPVRKLWGVGPAAEKQLLKLNIRTIGQLRATPAAMLREHFGESGEHYHRLASGVDNRPVTPDREAKSIGQEQTFAQDVGELEELHRVCHAQAYQVARRLRRQGLKARTVTLKLRYGDFTTLSRAATLAEPTDLTDHVWGAARTLLDHWAAKELRPLRLLGVTASNLASPSGGQLALFSDPKQEKHRRLDRTLDDIANRFGPGAIRSGDMPADEGDEPNDNERSRD